MYGLANIATTLFTISPFLFQCSYPSVDPSTLEWYHSPTSNFSYSTQIASNCAVNPDSLSLYNATVVGDTCLLVINMPMGVTVYDRILTAGYYFCKVPTDPVQYFAASLTYYGAVASGMSPTPYVLNGTEASYMCVTRYYGAARPSFLWRNSDGNTINPTDEENANRTFSSYYTTRAYIPYLPPYTCYITFPNQPPAATDFPAGSAGFTDESVPTLLLSNTFWTINSYPTYYAPTTQNITITPDPSTQQFAPGQVLTCSAPGVQPPVDEIFWVLPDGVIVNSTEVTLGESGDINPQTLMCTASNSVGSGSKTVEVTLIDSKK